MTAAAPVLQRLRRSRLRSRLSDALGLLLAALLATNAALVLRAPHGHAGRAKRPGAAALPPFPEIPLRRHLATAAPTPGLAAPGRIESVTELRAWQARGRGKLAELLGVTPPDRAPRVRVVGSERVGSLHRETLVFEQEDGVEVPAFLFVPDAAGPRPALAVIPGHSWGIVATAGIVDDTQHANALRLAQAGYVVLTMEVRGFGYLRQLGDSDFPMDHGPFMGYNLVRGATPIGVTVRDAATGLLYLTSRPEVAADRLGLVGFSSGCDAAIYLAALDPRVAALVASSCVSSHEANFRYSLNDAYEAVPGLANWLEMSDCLGLLSPRAVLVQWGARDNDRRTRSAAFNPSSLPIFAAARRIFASEGRADALEKRVTPGAGHEFDVEAAAEFLRRRLPVE